MKVLVTGASGFIGRNLTLRLCELGIGVERFTRDTRLDLLLPLVAECDAVVHLAGENRPDSPEAFETTNVGLTLKLVSAIRESGRKIPLLFASSIQAELDNPYGRSKARAEGFVVEWGRDAGVPVAIYRLPGVFGKWGRPNYNSVVATFCYNVTRDLPIQVNDPSRELRLVYVDDVIDDFIGWLRQPDLGVGFRRVAPEYRIRLGDLASQIEAFRLCRTSLEIGPVGNGLARALYATYVSHLPAERFSYEVPVHADPRGEFVEMLKTESSGQFSYFTARPGVTRGGHYHHTKTEKFLVLRGRARFSFRNVMTGEKVSLDTTGGQPRIVETIPGWAHDITNIGEEDLIVMLWANEVFDRTRPDTVTSKV